jgi:pSer/pThr/pTyr-binding forkhead associated (FHA) protein
MEIAFLVLRFLLAAALYAFLGWALWLLWSRLRQQAVRPRTPQIPGLTLTLQTREGRVFHTVRPEVMIGRQPGSDLRLEEGTISARHARLAYHHGQWWAEDLHSKNGTFLNARRIEAPLVLASGDALRCGELTLSVEIDQGAPVEASDDV